MTRVAPLALAATVVACGHTTTDPFPLDVGVQPLEPCTAPPPDPVTGDPYPETQTEVTGTSGGHDFAHSRAYVHAPLAAVWAAMQDPRVDRIHGTDTWLVNAYNLEPFPMSFRIHYTASIAEWEITYRGDVLESDPGGTPIAYGIRAQKTQGTSYIGVQSISAGARPVAGVADVVELEMVFWLHAAQSGPADAYGALTDFYTGLLASVRGQLVP